MCKYLFEQTFKRKNVLTNWTNFMNGGIMALENITTYSNEKCLGYDKKEIDHRQF